MRKAPKPSRGKKRKTSARRPTIPDKTAARLWLVAGGRCQFRGCNEPLWQDHLTFFALNRAYIAHIVAAEPGGPRGDAVRSPQLAQALSNLMLLCDPCHRRIDNPQNLAQFPEPTLVAMKAEHETRIAMLTGIQVARRSEVLRYAADIDAAVPSVGFEEVVQAMVPDRYPASRPGVALKVTGSALAEHDKAYWDTQQESLRRRFATDVSPRLRSGEIPHISVFAIAPQPLLMLLGSLLPDRNHADVFQLHREPTGWKWPAADVVGPNNPIFLLEPEGIRGAPALLLALSAGIARDRVTSVVGGDATIWTITAERPGNDMMRSREMLSQFRVVAREALSRIKVVHGEKATISVFSAAPVSASVEFGRVIMPKADLPLRVYDSVRRTGGFAFALDLNT